MEFCWVLGFRLEEWWDEFGGCLEGTEKLFKCSISSAACRNFGGEETIFSLSPNPLKPKGGVGAPTFLSVTFIPVNRSSKLGPLGGVTDRPKLVRRVDRGHVMPFTSERSCSPRGGVKASPSAPSSDTPLSHLESTFLGRLADLRSAGDARSSSALGEELLWTSFFLRWETRIVPSMTALP